MSYCVHVAWSSKGKETKGKENKKKKKGSKNCASEPVCKPIPQHKDSVSL